MTPPGWGHGLGIYNGEPTEPWATMGNERVVPHTQKEQNGTMLGELKEYVFFLWRSSFA